MGTRVSNIAIRRIWQKKGHCGPTSLAMMLSLYGLEMTAERLIEAAHRAHILGLALEQKQGATLEDYDMPEEIFVGNRKGDLPGVHFLTRELFEEIRSRVLDRFKEDATRFGYL